MLYQRLLRHIKTVRIHLGDLEAKYQKLEHFMTSFKWTGQPIVMTCCNEQVSQFRQARILDKTESTWKGAIHDTHYYTMCWTKCRIQPFNWNTSKYICKKEGILMSTHQNQGSDTTGRHFKICRVTSSVTNSQPSTWRAHLRKGRLLCKRNRLAYFNVIRKLYKTANRKEWVALSSSLISSNM